MNGRTGVLDLLVLGGGMAGLAAAARAAETGAHVAVAEKAGEAGGSAAMAAGILWTAPDFSTARLVAPHGDPALARALVDGFRPAVNWIRSMDVPVSEFWYDQFGFGIACRTDMNALLAALRARVERGRGRVILGAAGRQLARDRDGRVTGARVVGPGGDEELQARSVLLATGGFQGSREMLATVIGPAARILVVRSNPHSTGDGLRMGRAAGGAITGGNDGFYGHLLPSPLPELRPEQYLPLTQYYSNRCLLVNFAGRRFTDESLGDDVSNQAVLRQRESRAVILCDEEVHKKFAATAPYPHGQVVDRIAEAEKAGGHVARASTLEAMVRSIVSWGVDGDALRETLRDRGTGGLEQPPFFAVEVQPSITFPFAGLAVDAGGRVLDEEGQAIPGLLAAGADAGGVQHHRYVGGLALGLVFGPRAAETALSSRAAVQRRP